MDAPRLDPHPTQRATTFFVFLVKSQVCRHLLLQRDRRTRIRSRFRSINAHAEQKGFRAQTKWRLCGDPAQVFVHDLDLFVTVQILNDTPAVLSQGKLCEDHGYSHEWVSGQKPRLTKDAKRYYLQDGQLRTSCRSRVIHQFCKRFVFYIAITGLVEKRGRNSVQETGAIPRNSNIKIKRGMTRKIRTTRFQILLNGWRSSKKILWTQNCLHPHTVLRNQIWNVLRKWQRNQGSTVFILASQKTA